MKQRFGLLPNNLPKSKRQRIWIHAASVGEVKAANAIITEIYRQNIDIDFIVTTVTEQGQRIAQEEFGKKVITLYAPIDLPFIANRFIMRLQPTIYICMETELWPNILRLLHDNHIKALLLNGRLSESSFKNYLKIKGFIGQVVNLFSAISTIQTTDKDRYQTLGAAPEKISVNGNIKYDLGQSVHLAPQQIEKLDTETSSKFKKLLQISDQHTVLIAGSTHSGEEEELVNVFSTLAKSIKNFILIIAPRHLQRLPKIEKMLAKRSLSYQLYSETMENGRRNQLLLIDSMGELTKLYSIADYVFCGGSLVERGGHNIMEPAIWAKPPFYGPSMKDFSDACKLLEGAKASYPILSADEMAKQILYLHKHQPDYALASQRARHTALAQQGSAAKQVEIIKEALVS